MGQPTIVVVMRGVIVAVRVVIVFGARPRRGVGLAGCASHARVAVCDAILAAHWHVLLSAATDGGDAGRRWDIFVVVVIVVVRVVIVVVRVVIVIVRIVIVVVRIVIVVVRVVVVVVVRIVIVVVRVVVVVVLWRHWRRERRWHWRW